MKNIVKVNTGLGWALVIGIVATQLLITKITFDTGGMAPFYAFLTVVLFLPYAITAVVSVLSRERSLSAIKIGIKTGLFLQVVLPIILPLFFNKEFTYLGLIGILLCGTTWYFRKKIEVQLLILNGIGAIIWILIALVGFRSS